MKQSMTEFLYAMTESDMDSLYDIFTNKYHKFINAYFLLRRYLKFIVKLEYEEKTTKNKLKIKVSVVGIPSSDLCKALLNEPLSSFGDVDVKCSGKSSVKICIQQEEEDISN